MARPALEVVRLLGIALAIAAGCDGARGLPAPPAASGGQDGAGATGGVGGAAGQAGAGGGCPICSNPDARPAACPGASLGGLCLQMPPGSSCCQGSQQFFCSCPPGGPDCLWSPICEGAGGTGG